jgi:hypothetical protein
VSTSNGLPVMITGNTVSITVTVTVFFEQQWIVMEFEKNTVKNGENITKFEQVWSFLSLVEILKINNRFKRFCYNRLSLCYIALKYFVSPEIVKSGVQFSFIQNLSLKCPKTLQKPVFSITQKCKLLRFGLSYPFTVDFCL